MARTRLALAAVTVVTLAGLVAAALAGAGPFGRTALRPVLRSVPVLTPASVPPLAAAPVPVAARDLLAALDRARAAAYADPAVGDPDDWAAPACPCHAEDARRLRALVREGLVLRSAAVILVAVTVLRSRLRPPGAARARPLTLDLVVVDRIPAYAAADRRGTVVRRWPATGPRRWRIRLVRTGLRWRIGSIARAP